MNEIFRRKCIGNKHASEYSREEGLFNGGMKCDNEVLPTDVFCNTCRKRLLKWHDTLCNAGCYPADHQITMIHKGTGERIEFKLSEWDIDSFTPLSAEEHVNKTHPEYKDVMNEDIKEKGEKIFGILRSDSLSQEDQVRISSFMSLIDEYKKSIEGDERC